jgi:hypothetical protein
MHSGIATLIHIRLSGWIMHARIFHLDLSSFSTFLKQFKVKPPMFNGRDIFACDLNDTIRFDISTKGPSSENSVTISVKPNHQTMMRVDESCNSHSRLITSSILNWFKL